MILNFNIVDNILHHSPSKAHRDKSFYRKWRIDERLMVAVAGLEPSPTIARQTEKFINTL
jgi:hypothetical protein